MADISVKQQIIDKLKDSNNVLVTVSSNPSVDELSAALGITLLLNKLNKHATAVFSGAIPAAIEFLEPHKTFESTVDSLRDFIIALDKEKADHLRYKVVDDMVKIFITPYRTTISDKDLDFSQGDYNVEAVLAIGVKTEADLDKALESHGRILHDATVAAVSLGEATNLGGMEWTDKVASSYSEMLVELADGLKTDKNAIDEQIATAFLTGIVAATERFSNGKTTSKVMTTAAQLMAAGANQQLIATQLEEESVPLESKVAPGVLTENEVTKIEDQTPKVLATEAPKKNTSTGRITIDHSGEDAVDKATRIVGERKTEEAADQVQQVLQGQDVRPAAPQQMSIVAAAEKELADSLAAAATRQSENLHGSSGGQLDQGPVQPIDKPLMGGTLNATTEQAALEKQQAIEADRNRTILTHTATPYIAEEPQFQAPINATNSINKDEPKIPDILAAGHITSPTDHATAIQPPSPTVPASLPTLADIEAQHRVHQESAMGDVDAVPTAAAANPATGATMPTASLDMPPPLPQLPPMPDFSTLPPLPPAMGGGTPGDVLPLIQSVDTVGSMQTASSVDPAQFQIPSR